MSKPRHLAAQTFELFAKNQFAMLAAFSQGLPRSGASAARFCIGLAIVTLLTVAAGRLALLRG